MQIQLWINEKSFMDDIAPDTLLIDYLRANGFHSVKRGCETANCGLCTVWLEKKPVLSCSILAVRANGMHITTLEGVREEAQQFAAFMAAEGAEQCGFCSPGFVMNVLAMKRELTNPDEEQMKQYLMGNLCRCTGYMAQLRAVRGYLAAVKEEA